MDSGLFDSLTRSIGSRRRALAAVFGGTLGLAGLADSQDVDAGSKSKKRKKKKQKRKKQEAFNRYNDCLVNTPNRICGSYGIGCPSRNFSALCADCYNSIEACCERELISSAARCACMDSTVYAVCPV